MLRIPLNDDKTLIVSSNWDSGTHCGFHAAVAENDNYNSQTLDRVLTKSQILELEALLICRIRAMLNKEEPFEKVLAAGDVQNQIETQEKEENPKK